MRKRSAQPDPNSSINVSVLLRRRDELPVAGTVTVSHEQFAARYGANPEDIPAIEEFAQDNDLTIVEIDLARRTVVLTGTVANMNEAFGTSLTLYQGPDGVFRGRVGELTVPVSLRDIVLGVFGLDERPQADMHFRRLIQIGPRAAGDTSYTPIAVSKLYDYPTATGAGQTVAIIELGGGFAVSDLKTYFSGLGLKTTPSVTAVSVDGARNQPAGDPNSADGEVLLDIEVVGAIAPAAKIVVYFAPNTDQGFLDAVTQAVHDTVHNPSVISISWGGPESTWTAQSLSAFDQAFQDAAALGVTVCVAAGDNGSSDGETDGAAHVDFPASSPHALACGGTRLESANSKDHERGGVERGRKQRRHRRRRKRYLPTALVPGEGQCAGLGEPFALQGARRARRRRRRRPSDRVSDSRRRKGRGVRRHQRGGSAMGGFDCAGERRRRQTARLYSPGPIRRANRISRYYVGEQRGLLGRKRLGCVHRARDPGWESGSVGCEWYQATEPRRR